MLEAMLPSGAIPSALMEIAPGGSAKSCGSDIASQVNAHNSSEASHWTIAPTAIVPAMSVGTIAEVQPPQFTPEAIAIEYSVACACGSSAASASDSDMNMHNGVAIVDRRALFIPLPSVNRPRGEASEAS